MALDGKILAAAKVALAERVGRLEAERARRRRAVYAKRPRVQEIDRTLRTLVIEAAAAALRHGEDPAAAIAALSETSQALQEERALELTAAGFPSDWLDEKPFCEKCGDTGYDGTALCACLTALYREKQAESLSSLLRLGDATFDSFDLSWYDDTPDPVYGVSSRANMEVVYETCVQYARRFGRQRGNLFLCGPPGLGKTFLSACIARVVSESGYSVVYDTAGAVFSRFEEEKFGKSDDPGAVRAQLRRYLECDLLILDDLGTEMTTAYTISVLYELVNTRLITGKKTVINSNLTFGEMHGRYSEQIMSRLEGEYDVLRFYGTDIRRLKKQK